MCPNHGLLHTHTLLCHTHPFPLSVVFLVLWRPDTPHTPVCVHGWAPSRTGNEVPMPEMLLPSPSPQVPRVAMQTKLTCDQQPRTRTCTLMVAHAGRSVEARCFTLWYAATKSSRVFLLYSHMYGFANPLAFAWREMTIMGNHTCAHYPGACAASRVSRSHLHCFAD